MSLLSNIFKRQFFNTSRKYKSATITPSMRCKESSCCVRKKWQPQRLPEFAIKRFMMEENVETYSKKRQKDFIHSFYHGTESDWSLIFETGKREKGKGLWRSHVNVWERNREVKVKDAHSGSMLSSAYKKILQISVPGDWRLMFAKKKQKSSERNLFHLFSVYLSLEFKTKKKWKCTFSNEHWFLLQGRIWLVLKAF